MRCTGNRWWCSCGRLLRNFVPYTSFSLSNSAANTLFASLNVYRRDIESFYVYAIYRRVFYTLYFILILYVCTRIGFRNPSYPCSPPNTRCKSAKRARQMVAGELWVAVCLLSLLCVVDRIKSQEAAKGVCIMQVVYGVRYTV